MCMQGHRGKSEALHLINVTPCRLLNIERGKCVPTFIEYHKTLGNYRKFNQTLSIVIGLVKEKNVLGHTFIS